jgi:pimeloyl-ACP methyl ester carboxylesterase
MFIFAAFLSSCGNGRLAYTPAELEAFRSRPLATELVFEGRTGSQTCFYVAPREGVRRLPRPLVIVYPGITARALDWLWLADECPLPTAGFLFIDYPGRGLSEGLMRPKHLPGSTHGALEALRWELDAPVRFFTRDARLIGHSFGSGAALQAAQDFEPRAVVLAAPFHHLRSAMLRTLGLVALLNPDQMDNRKYLKALFERQGPERLRVSIFHGAQDPTLPVWMSRELVALFPDRIDYHEIADGDHVDILVKCRADIYAALFFDHAISGEADSNAPGEGGAP